jgi:outer membrane protein assembly factor BamA
VDRNFLGGARRLELNAAVSKLGVGSSGGLENTFLCRGLQTPDSASRLDKAINTSVNYRLAANFLQPRFFGTHTSVTAGGHLEQTSEIGLYLRHSAGAQLGVARRVAPRTVVSGSLNAERGNTDARDVFYCRALQVCDPAAIGPLKKPRWSNSLSVGAVHNATRGTLAPTSGFQARTQLDLASRVLRSDDSYLRLLADGALYRQVRTGWILSGRLMGGTFISGLEGPNGYIPPERRFYGGGANSVRGFATNALGPTVYVIDRFKVHHPKGDTVTVTSMDTLTDGSATGGRRTVLASAELTMPSPFLASYFRFATFVDAGQVWDPPTDSVVSHPGLRVTPGVGLRIATPVGPIRLDVAYNPYGPEPGPLYAIDPAGGLFRVKNRYVPPQRGGFLRRHLAFQVAVGSPF